jgi:hypothetical protein
VLGLSFIITCGECHRRWLPDDDERWRAYLGVEEDIEEPAELVFYCPECAKREFGDGN